MVQQDLTRSIADTVRQARQVHGLSTAGLAASSGVSRAMISKIERAEVQPTAVLLGRLSGALGMTLSELLARAERPEARLLVRADEQPVWIDPDTGYRRRSISPSTESVLELVEIELPAGAAVDYPAEAFVFPTEQIWVLAGRLDFHQGDVLHQLDAGDCLEVRHPTACRLANTTQQPCRYLVAIAKRHPPA